MNGLLNVALVAGPLSPLRAAVTLLEIPVPANTDDKPELTFQILCSERDATNAFPDESTHTPLASLKYVEVAAILSEDVVRDALPANVETILLLSILRTLLLSESAISNPSTPLADEWNN